MGHFPTTIPSNSYGKVILQSTSHCACPQRAGTAPKYHMQRLMP
jgi:hypothetical protein